MAKIVTFFDSYGTLATAFEAAGLEVAAAILSNDDEREFYREKFENRVFVFNENINQMCTCGVRHRNPVGLIGKLPETVYEENGNLRSQKELINQIVRFTRDAKPNTVLVETTKDFLDNEEKFKFLTEKVGDVGYDCFVLLHPHKSYVLWFSQEKNFVEGFDFPEIKSEEKVTKEYCLKLAETIKNQIVEEAPAPGGE